MQKIALAVLLALPLVACDKGGKPATQKDFETVQQELNNNPPAEIMSVGPAGDFAVYMPATPALKDVASRIKNSKFKSAQITPEQIKDDLCIINIVPKKVMENEGTPENTCYYRVFCGAADTNFDELYSVEVCEK